jgi:DNA-binding NarL/FixJ family response regulator
MGVLVEGEYAGGLALDHVERAVAVHHRMDAQHIYRKLGIHKRSELISYLHRDG